MDVQARQSQMQNDYEYETTTEWKLAWHVVRVGLSHDVTDDVFKWESRGCALSLSPLGRAAAAALYRHAAKLVKYTDSQNKKQAQKLTQTFPLVALGWIVQAVEAMLSSKESDFDLVPAPTNLDCVLAHLPYIITFA